jgi:hypothetical protein
VTSPVGAQPGVIGVGDFNEDGKLDVAVGNPAASTVTILLGNGDGTMSSPAPITLAPTTSSVTVGSIDGDAHLDLAVGTRPSGGGVGTISILTGKGDGTFTIKVAYALTAPGPTQTLILDVNGDGKRDLVMVTNNGNTVATMLGNGDGTFVTPPTLSSTNALPTGIVAGHFFPEAAVAVVTSSNQDGTLEALHGPGDGGSGFFTFETSYPSGGSQAPALVAHDFNGDGILDLLVADGISGTFSVLFGLKTAQGAPSGAFGTPTTYALGSNVTSVALGDFNKDGLQDVAVARRVNKVAVFLARPDMGAAGTFVLDGNFTVGNLANFVATGDFNNDGKIDVVCSNFNDSTISVLLNDRP